MSKTKDKDVMIRVDSGTRELLKIKAAESRITLKEYLKRFAYRASYEKIKS